MITLHRVNHSPGLLAPERSLAASEHPLACRIAWASDIRLDLYAGLPAEDQHTTRGNHIERLGAAWARESTADLLLITGGISTSVGLAEQLTDLQRGWGRRIAFVVGDSDRLFSKRAVVDDMLRRLQVEAPGLIWLTEAEPIELSPRCALVGADSFCNTSRANDVRILEQGIRGAEAGERTLLAALALYDEVLFATHDPPWRHLVLPPADRSAWYVQCEAGEMGEMIQRVARAHPRKKVRVLCGAVREAADFDIAPNLACSTAASVERHPTIFTHVDLPR